MTIIHGSSISLTPRYHVQIFIGRGSMAKDLVRTRSAAFFRCSFAWYRMAPTIPRHLKLQLVTEVEFSFRDTPRGTGVESMLVTGTLLPSCSKGLQTFPRRLPQSHLCHTHLQRTNILQPLLRRSLLQSHPTQVHSLNQVCRLELGHPKPRYLIL